MRLLLLVVTFLIAFSGSSQAQERGIGPEPNAISEPLPWNRYTVKGEKFSVSLPTVPAMATSKALRNGDQKPRLERHLKTSFDGVVYSIDVFENTKPPQSLEEFVGQQISNSDYDPATEESLKVDGVRGKQYSSVNKSSPAIVQFFATDARLYRFAAIGSNVGGRPTRDFFLSIKLSQDGYSIEVSDGPGIPLGLDTIGVVYKGNEVDVKAKLLSYPAPSLTGKSQDNRTRGIVVLKVIFAKTGRVESIRVVQGLADGLTESAVEAAKKIKFIPAKKDGKPVSMWMQLEYNFSLDLDRLNP